MSSTYHPESDGTTEHANQTLIQMIHELVNLKQTDWVQKIATIEFTLNCMRSDLTRFSPFFLNTGCMPCLMVWNSTSKSEFPTVHNFMLQ